MIVHVIPGSVAKFEPDMKFYRIYIIAVFVLFMGASRLCLALEPVATIEGVKGTVMVRRAGMVMWENAEEGLLVSGGDTIKTQGTSGAIVRFTVGGLLKIRPMAEITLDVVIEESGLKSNVVSVARGRIWVQAEEDDATERMILEAAGTVIDMKAGTFFMEASEDGRTACTDVFSGGAQFRTYLEPGDVKSMQTENRQLFEAGHPAAAPTSISDEANPEDTDYSCLPGRKAEQKNIEVGPGGEKILILSAMATVVFAGDGEVSAVVESETEEEMTLLLRADASVTFSDGGGVTIESDTDEEIVVLLTASARVTFGEDKAKGSGVIILGSETAAMEEVEIVILDKATVTFATQEPQEDTPVVIIQPPPADYDEPVAATGEDEYEILVITDQETVIFSCSTPPKMENVTLNGQSVSSGSTVQVTGGECDASVKADIAWKLTPVCGAVTSNVFSVGDASVAQDGVAEGQSGSFGVSIELSTEDLAEVKISASDNFNNVVQDSFKVQFIKHENVSKPPTLTSVSYGGGTVTAGQTVDVSIEDCVEGAFAISGTAASVCGGITSVAVTQDGEGLTVTGQEEWSANHKVAATEGKSSFTIIAEASNGEKSESFSFNISYKVDEALLAPPSIGSVTFDGSEVSSGGSAGVTFDTCDGKTLKISGTAAATCAGIASVSVTRGDTELTVSGQETWSTEYSAFEQGDSTVSVVATDAKGQQSDAYTFTVTHSIEGDLLLPPVITSVDFAGTDVSDGDGVETTIENCDGAVIKVSGTAAASCSDISMVWVTRNGEGLVVTGGAEWSAQYRVDEQGDSTFSVKAMDSKYRQGDSFTFTATHNIDDVLLAPPSVSSVVFNGSEISDGGSAEVPVESCDDASITISGEASSACAEIESVSVTRGEEALSVTGGAEWNTAYNVNVDDQGDSTITVIPKDADGMEGTPFTFTVTHNVDESLTALPKIESVTFDGSEVTDGGSSEKTITNCEGATIEIAGTASAGCSGVASVSVSKGEEALTVTGEADWSAEYRVNETAESTITITPTDGDENQGAPFTFTVSHAIDDALLVPPVIETVFYGDTEVSSDDTVPVSFETCDAVESTITGTVSTPCDDLSGISLTKDDQDVTISGTGEWTADDSVLPADEEAFFKVTATNAAGDESETFEFSVEPDIENIPMPETEMETISNVAIEDFFTPVNKNRDDLESGELVIRGSVVSEGCSVQRVEVSVDGGGTWEEAEGTDSWTYGFEPSDDTYYISARSIDSLDRESDPGSELELIYTQLTSEDEIMDIFDRLIQAYIDKDSSTFMDLTSLDYTSEYEGIEDTLLLETSLENKFSAYDTIYLIYSADSPNVSGDSGSVSFSWNANSSVSGYPFSGVFYFVKEDEGWKFSTVDDDNTFLRYTSVAASVLLTASDYILTANTDETTLVYAEVRDSANNLIKDGTTVTFSKNWLARGQVYPDTSSLTASAETVDGVALSTFDAAGSTGTVEITAVSGDVSDSIEIEVEVELAPLPPGWE